MAQKSTVEQLTVGQPPAGKDVNTETDYFVGTRYQARLVKTNREDIACAVARSRVCELAIAL